MYSTDDIRYFPPGISASLDRLNCDNGIKTRVLSQSYSIFFKTCIVFSLPTIILLALYRLPLFSFAHQAATKKDTN